MDYYLSHYPILLQACLLLFLRSTSFFCGFSCQTIPDASPWPGQLSFNVTHIYSQHQASSCLPHSLKSLPRHRGAFHSTSPDISSSSPTLMIWLCDPTADILLGRSAVVGSCHWLFLFQGWQGESGQKIIWWSFEAESKSKSFTHSWKNVSLLQPKHCYPYHKFREGSGSEMVFNFKLCIVLEHH